MVSWYQRTPKLTIFPKNRSCDLAIFYVKTFLRQILILCNVLNVKRFFALVNYLKVIAVNELSREVDLANLRGETCSKKETKEKHVT